MDDKGSSRAKSNDASRAITRKSRAISFLGCHVTNKWQRSSSPSPANLQRDATSSTLSSPSPFTFAYATHLAMRRGSTFRRAAALAVSSVFISSVTASAPVKVSLRTSWSETPIFLEAMYVLHRLRNNCSYVPSPAERQLRLKIQTHSFP